MPIENSETMVFQQQRPIGSRPYWQLAAGAGSLLLALTVFALQVGTPPEEQMSFVLLVGTVVVFSLLAIATIGNAVWLLRAPTRVELQPDAVVLLSTIACKRVPWEAIGKLETDKRDWPLVGQETRLLILYGKTGSKLAVITDWIGEFDRLYAAVQSRILPIVDNPVVDARLRRSKRMATIFIAFGLLIATATIFLAVNGWQTKVNLALMQSEGREIEATATKHYIYNVTPRINYTFSASNGSKYTRDTEMTRAAWDRAEGRKTIAVHYVPSNPDFSRLVEGEGDPAFDNWKMLLGTSAGGFVMTILIFFAAALRWNGRDIVIDQKTHKLRIVDFHKPDGS